MHALSKQKKLLIIADNTCALSRIYPKLTANVTRVPFTLLRLRQHYFVVAYTLYVVVCVGFHLTTDHNSAPLKSSDMLALYK